MLYGGNGNDLIISAANDLGTFAFGEAGDDNITVVSGTADGGDGDDTYTVNTSKLVTIRDDGQSANDTLILSNVHSAADFQLMRVGNDLYLYDRFDTQGEVPDHGVKLQDWFAGFNTIENFRAVNGDVLPITLMLSACLADTFGHSPSMPCAIEGL